MEIYHHCHLPNYHFSPYPTSNTRDDVSPVTHWLMKNGDLTGNSQENLTGDLNGDLTGDLVGPYVGLLFSMERPGDYL